MIKKILLLFLFSLNYLFSDSLIIEDSFKNSTILASNHQTTYIDETSSLSFDEIQKLDKFEKINKTNFKASKNHIWTKLTIKNNSTQNKRLFLENDRALLDVIDVYILKDDSLYSTLLLGDSREIKQREIQTRKSTFTLDLEKDETYTIYTMHKGYSSISTYWLVFDRQNYIKTSTLESIAWGIFIGIIIMLISYNLILYMSIKDISFLVYIIMSLFFAMYQSYVNGIYYQFFSTFNIEFFQNLNWTISFFAQGLTMLFPLVFFKPAKNSYVFKHLVALIFINFSVAFFYLFSIQDPELRYLTKYTDYVNTLTIPTLLFVSIWAIKNRLAGSIFYSFGQVSYFTLIFYGVFVSLGYFDTFPNLWIVVPLGIILDVIFLSFALFMKVKKIEKERLENEQLLISQARFSTMGQTIADLTHQWKTPIAQLGSQVLLLKATHDLDKNNFDNTFKTTISQIENSINFLNHTMDDIYNFYSNPSSKENFILEKEIDAVLRILKEKIEKNSIEIIKESKKTTYFGYKNAFSNSIITILENAIYQLTNFKEENDRKIIIKIDSSNENIILTIEDNGGGIKNKNFEELFHVDFSSKRNQGSGVGLALSKRLIENKLNGKISAKNSNIGAIFEILLPKY